MEYRPSTNVVWAWRNLRALEDAGYELERPGARDAPSFNLAFHLPEALRAGHADAADARLRGLTGRAAPRAGG